VINTTTPSYVKFPISGGTNSAADWNSTILETNGNYIASGMTPTDGGGLVLNVASGVAYCAGIRFNLGAGTGTLAASNTNYVFYDPATLDYSINTTGTQPTNSVRIATVVTGVATITTITDKRQFKSGSIVLSPTSGVFPYTVAGSTSAIATKTVDLTGYPIDRIIGLIINMSNNGGGAGSTGNVSVDITVNGTSTFNTAYVLEAPCAHGSNGLFFAPKYILGATTNAITVSSTTQYGGYSNATITSVYLLIM